MFFYGISIIFIFIRSTKVYKLLIIHLSINMHIKNSIKYTYFTLTIQNHYLFTKSFKNTSCCFSFMHICRMLESGRSSLDAFRSSTEIRSASKASKPDGCEHLCTCTCRVLKIRKVLIGPLQKHH